MRARNSSACVALYGATNAARLCLSGTAFRQQTYRRSSAAYGRTATTAPRFRHRRIPTARTSDSERAEEVWNVCRRQRRRLEIVRRAGSSIEGARELDTAQRIGF